MKEGRKEGRKVKAGRKEGEVRNEGRTVCFSFGLAIDCAAVLY